MKILFVLHMMDLDGSTMSILETIKTLQDYEPEIFIIAPFISGKMKQNLKDFKITYAQCDFKWGVKNTVKPNSYSIFEQMNALLFFIKKIREWNIDIVHTNTSVVSIGSLAAMLCKVPHVWHFRENFYNMNFMPRNFLLYQILVKNSYVITVSKKLVEHLKEKKLYRKAITIYDNINADVFYLDKELFSPKNLLMCGAINENKGQMHAIKAIDILIKRGINCSLTLVGKAEPVYLKQIKKYIDKNSLNEHIVIKEQTKDIIKEYEAADILLSCSRSEGISRVIVEGMLSKLLIIASDVESTNELICNQRNGLLYEYGNIVDLANKINEVIEQPLKYTYLLKNAQREALEKFNSKKNVAKIYKVYSYLSNKKNIK